MKSRKGKVKIRLTVFVIVFLIMIISLSVYFDSKILPIIIDITTAKVVSLATAAVNNAVFKALNENIEYSDLITVYSDNSGKINMIEANMVRINSLARETSKASQDLINKLGEQGLDIPIGTLTGSPLLIGQGPLIHIKMIPIGTVDTTFASEFTEAGINQTRHKILLTIIANVEIVLPVTRTDIVCDTEILVCENVLIGSVPNTYLELSASEMLNLLP